MRGRLASIIAIGRVAVTLAEGRSMPVHDWTRVNAGIFHDFHPARIEEINGALNRGIPPPDHYALAEQIAGGLGPDVLTLQGPTNGAAAAGDPQGGIALATAPPQVYFH